MCIIVCLLYSIEFLCIRRTYYLLYQSLVPNCKMTIGILRQHCQIASDVEQYILNGKTARLRSQRILDFLLSRLDKSKDCMEFCKFLRLTSVLNNLSDKMISGTHIIVIQLITDNVHEAIVLEFQKSRYWNLKVPLCFKQSTKPNIYCDPKYGT